MAIQRADPLRRQLDDETPAREHGEDFAAHIERIRAESPARLLDVMVAEKPLDARGIAFLRRQHMANDAAAFLLKPVNVDPAFFSKTPPLPAP